MNNTALFNQVAEVLKSEGIEPTKNMVISIVIKTLTEAGLTVRDAFEGVMGEGSFNELAYSTYEQLRY